MIQFFAAGRAEPKGSTRAFVQHGRAIVTNDNPKAKAWARVVSLRAREAMQGRAPMAGPMRIALTFYLERPRYHYRTGRYSHLFKPSAPLFPDVLPDGDKLERCTWDALKGIVWLDDGQVVRWRGGKEYADATHPPGVVVMVEAIGAYREDGVREVDGT